MRYREFTEAVYSGNLGMMELAQFLRQHPEHHQRFYDIKSQQGVRAALEFVLKKLNVKLSGEPYKAVAEDQDDQGVVENFADGKVKGKSRPGRVKRSGASCNGSVTDLRKRAKNASGERAKMLHWCANMKSGRKK